MSKVSKLLDSARTFLFAALLALQSFATWPSEHFKQEKLAEIETEMNRAIEEHRLPGGVIWIESQGAVYHKAFGHRAIVPQAEPMTEDTIFDVASMTKVLATVPALMLLRERGKLNIDELARTYLPEFTGGGKEAITLRHLLTHTSGFDRALSQFPDWAHFPKAFQAICAQQLARPPGTLHVYSDINFIILGELFQRVSGERLDKFVAREIYRPLKMGDTSFLPTADKLPRIAPTEKIGSEVLRGKVHDPKGRAMGGVAGHAGVFTTAADLARFARMMLNQGELDGVRIFQPATIKLMTSVQTGDQVEARRGLGWDIDSDFSRPRGNIFPIGSYGHSGFTGCSLWIDPFSRTFVMLLSNRVHPDSSANIYALQRDLGTLAAEAVEDFNFSTVPGALAPRRKP